jgi:hypothetical protein
VSNISQQLVSDHSQQFSGDDSQKIVCDVPQKLVPNTELTNRPQSSLSQEIEQLTLPEDQISERTFNSDEEIHDMSILVINEEDENAYVPFLKVEV